MAGSLMAWQTALHELLGMKFTRVERLKLRSSGF